MRKIEQKDLEQGLKDYMAISYPNQQIQYEKTSSTLIIAIGDGFKVEARPTMKGTGIEFTRFTKQNSK